MPCAFHNLSFCEAILSQSKKKDKNGINLCWRCGPNRCEKRQGQTVAAEGNEEAFAKPQGKSEESRVTSEFWLVFCTVETAASKRARDPSPP
jgi:hypothetical protein